MDAKQAVVVGVNQFAREVEPGVPTQRIDERLEKQQVDRLQALRVRRDAGVHAAALRAVEDSARNGGNLMPAILTAVESFATVGEIATTLRGVFGEYRETVGI